MMERLFRGSEPDRFRGRNVFDAVAEGHRHGLRPEVSLAIWESVRREATDNHEELDEIGARQRFHALATQIAARCGQLGPGPGGTTLVEAESRPSWARSARVERAVGKTTVVETEARHTGFRQNPFAPAIPGKTTREEAERHRPAETWRRDEADATTSDLSQGMHLETLLGSVFTAPANVPAPSSTHRPPAKPSRARPGLTAFDVCRHVLTPDTNAARVVSRDEAWLAALRGEVMTIAHALALDLGALQVVVDDRARARLNAAGVRGMQEGQVVYLRPDAYQPGTEDGSFLLAHELVHAAQRKLPARPGQGYGAAEAEATSIGMMYARGQGLARPTIGLSAGRAAREEPGSLDEKLLADPPAVKRSVQMLHVVYEALAGGATWTGGIDKKREAMAMVLKDLVQRAYSVALLDQLIASQGGPQALEVTGALHGQATQNERITAFRLSAGLMLGVVDWLSAPPRNLKSLSPDQLAVLHAGVDVEDTWPDVRSDLAPWATLELYAAFMGVTQAALLKKFGQARRLMTDKPGDANARALHALHAHVVAAIRPAFRAMDAVRTDKLLAKEAAYRVLWDLPVVPAGKNTEVALANAGNPAPLRAGLFFLVDAHTYPALAESAPSEPRARKQLLERFKVRLGSQSLPTDGDFVLHDGPVHGVRPPLASSLTSYPALEAPFFDTPKGEEREFVMNVEFPDVFEAFRGYVYKWELIHVAQDDIDQLSQTANALGDRGDSPDQLAVLHNRLGRDAQYGSADIRRSIQQLESELGSPGCGAVSLAATNAMLRIVGTVMKTFIETLVKPRYEKTMPFPKDGLYIVRCISWPRPLDGAMADRAPSVAWLPVWVRPARDMSRLRAHLDRKVATGTVARLQEIDDQLADRSLSNGARAALDDEKQQIERLLHAKGNDLLEQEKLGLQTAQGTAEGSQKEAIDKRLSEIDQILKMRSGRLAGAKADGSLEAILRIPAAFIGDNGQTIRPLFEVFEKPASGGRVSYHAVDSTTKNGGHRTGTGMTREDAIASAIQAVLESDQGYGRGYVTLTIPPAPNARSGAEPIYRTTRIEKNLGALMAEAVENVTMVASIAALAAAPFTGGASLTLLVPIGIVGAVPSAYRLLDRGQQGTLRLDMATAMDIVNILGAAVGAGQASAAGTAALRGMPLGRGWMFLGLGNDGLGMMVAGAGVIDQIHELARDPNLPPGQRKAMIAQILGTQLMQLGIAAGVQLHMYGKTQQEHLGGRKHAVDHPLIEPHLQDQFRGAVGAKGESITLYRDVDGKQVAGRGVEIHYERDGYGLPTELRVIAGPTAGEAEILLHARAAERMLAYQGFVGYLRNLYDRAITLFKSGALPPKPGSRAWEARLELETKLPQAIDQVYADLGTGRISPAVADSRIRDLREQMLVHERALNEVGEGHGFIAIHDGVTKKAIAHGYPSPPHDHFYFETVEGQFQLQRNVESDAAPYHITWRDGRPYVAPGPLPSTEAALDVTALRAHSAAWLSVAPDRVIVHADPTVEHVSVRPAATPDGPYEIHFKPGMSEADIQAAIDKHLELAARRPDPDRPRRSADRPWTFDDETAFRGTQHGRKVPAVAVSSDEISRMAEVKALVAAGKLDEALDYICNAYGFTRPNMRVVILDRIPGSWAYVDGNIEEGAIQTVHLERDLFNKDYAFLVRTVGHEYEHVVQHSQKNPILDRHEREFLAWSWEALDPTGPQYDSRAAAAHAQNALLHYNLMSPTKKEQHVERKRKLDAVVAKAQ